MADLVDLLRKRRSVRDFETKEVSLDLIMEIIKDSCLAPSSGNGQPWRFIIVNNKEWIKKLSDESKKNLVSYIEKNPDALIKNYEDTLRNKYFNIFYNAPCLVYIVGPKDLGSVYVDCALAACYFMFSASARGLGTCWIGLGTNIQDPHLITHIGMPKDYQIIAPIIIGYSKSTPETPERMEPQVLKVVS